MPKVGWPDYQRPTIIVKQAVPLELIQQWMAREVEYFAIRLMSGLLTPGQVRSIDTQVPKGEIWFLYQVWGQASRTQDAGVDGPEIWFYNWTKSLWFAQMTASRVGFHQFSFALPFPNDPGDLLTVVFYNTTAYDQRYYAGFGGYKIPASPKPKDWPACKSLREFLSQPGIIGLDYQLEAEPPRVLVVNHRLGKVYKFKVWNFQTPKESAELEESYRFEERKSWKKYKF